MDWGKAKNIFIIVFLLLNISLGYQLYIKNIQNNHHIQWNGNNIEDLKQMLDEQQINLIVDIPREVPEMHFIQIKSRYFADTDSSVNIQAENINKNEIDSIAKELIYNFDDYIYSSADSNGQNRFVYYQINNDYPYFGAKLQIDVNDDGSITYSQNYYEAMNQGLDRQVISAYSALRTVLEQQLIPNGAEINKVMLGYQAQTGQSTIQLLTPVWKIAYTVNDKTEEIYINALTGGLQSSITY